MLDKLYNGTVDWLKKPFNEEGSAVDWFLFVGLMLAIGWLWSRIIERIG